MRLIIIGILMLLASCGKDEGLNYGYYTSNQNDSKWSIPINNVFDGGPGKDGIPALTNPRKSSVSAVSYLENSDLILGYYNGVDAVAYPHKILDWHEIINDEISSFPFAITYCPLTGTGIGWDRTIGGTVTTFGVSGLIYNNNLIPYDRQTDSNWSQMRLECVNGSLIGTKIKTFTLVETAWATWTEMYPNSKVITLKTGYDRTYDKYPYGPYKTDHGLILFPIDIDDKRLQRKERVHGIISNGRAKVYRFETFGDQNTLVMDRFNGNDVLIIGNKSKNFIVSFLSQLEDGTTPVFTAVDDGNIILKDDLGNRWDIFGHAVSGPSQGSRLKQTESFMGYWFAWGTFFPNVEIYE